MGEPKHLLRKSGKPQYQFIYDLLTSCSIQSCISCNKEQADSLDSKYPLIVDTYDSIGPIGGIATAFNQEPDTSWLVVACDLVNVNEGAITNLTSANNPERAVTTYRKADSSFFETTLTIYNPLAARFVQESIKAKDYSLQGLIKKCNVKTIEVSSYDFLKNVNTKSDYLNS